MLNTLLFLFLKFVPPFSQEAVVCGGGIVRIDCTSAKNRSRELVVTLIEEYKSHECLWNIKTFFV